MSDYIYSEEEVREMWARSYEDQISIAQAKALEAIVRTDGKLIVSFSGGKDSAVVLYIMAQMWSISKHKTEPLQVAFSNTSNEFACMENYIKMYCAFIEEKFGIETNFSRVRGDQTYFEVVEEVGYPFISKKVSRMVRAVKKTLKRLGYTYKEIEKYMPKAYTKKHIESMIKSAEKLRELGFNDAAILYLTKIRSDDKIGLRFLPLKYRPMLDWEEEFSEQCCDRLKKAPLHKLQASFNGYLPVTGEMAADSRDRMETYRKTGCNYFDRDKPKSKPIGPVTEQTVLRFIYEEEIPIAPVYGSVILEDKEYRTTEEGRTGCKLCGFGLAFDQDRFIRLQKYEPQVVKFAFTSRENGGLGYREICKKLNEQCKMNIEIPETEEGYYKKRAEEYKRKRKKEFNHE